LWRSRALRRDSALDGPRMRWWPSRWLRECSEAIATARGQGGCGTSPRMAHRRRRNRHRRRARPPSEGTMPESPSCQDAHRGRRAVQRVASPRRLSAARGWPADELADASPIADTAPCPAWLLGDMGMRPRASYADPTSGSG
jgi:hypothetical protein